METNGAIVSNGKGSDYFLPLKVKSKQRYKVKINTIQQCEPYQDHTAVLKKDEKFPPVQ